MEQRNHLLSVAVGDYQVWRPLVAPVLDAAALRKVLFSRYAFAPERSNEYPERLLAIVTREKIRVRPSDLFPDWTVFDTVFRSVGTGEQLLMQKSGSGSCRHKIGNGG